MNQNKVLFIGLVWPEPTSSAAGKRILQLVEFFLNRGDEVVFSSAAAKNESSFDLSDFSFRYCTVQNDKCHSERSVSEAEGSHDDFSDSSIPRNEKKSDSPYLAMTKEVPIQLNDSSFNEFVKELNPGIVVYDRFVSEEQFGWRISEECPEALQILDTEDLHLLRSAREKAFRKNEQINLYNEIAVREIASILRCDLSLVISEFEMNLLQNEFNISPELIHYLPFMENVCYSEKRRISENKSIEISPLHCVPVEMTQEVQFKAFEERKDFVFIGNFLHEPNWQTVLHLKNNIWPKIKSKLPATKLNIYGAYPSQKVWDLHNEKEGVLVHGKAGDALGVMENARILLAPIPFGAGQKGKFIDAMHAGTPIATTTVGAESMFEKIIPGIAEDNENEFVRKTVELYENKDTWAEMQKTGFQILKEKFDKNLFEENLNFKIKNLQSELIQHRNRNFIGQILKHNSANAIKYMSLWIEEKNKKPNP